MDWKFWAFLGCVTAVVYGVPRLFKRNQNVEQEEPELVTVKLFDGPKDGTVHQVQADNKPHFFIQPYLPMDEETGMPKQENIVGQMQDRAFYKPSYAYYTAVTDEDYFYIRDITENEVEALQHGYLPTVEPNDATKE